jgi:spore maturation protein CgeB
METVLKLKNVLLVAWGVENPKDTYMHQIYYTLLKKIFPKLDTFDSKKNYFQFGKDNMNISFLSKIQSSNYDLIIFAMEYDEFYPETLKKLRELCPKSKLVIIICDDDAKFDNWSRYFSLFFDYTITSQDFLKEYKKEGIDAFFHLDYNLHNLSPMKVKKIYDVTFIGRPKADRNEVIRYLLDKGVKVTLFGWDWYKYPEFAKIYRGPLSQEDYAKVINQSKINLSPAKAGYIEQRNQYNMKGRYFEVALCKSFQLIEKFPTLLKFFNEKEIGMYSSPEEMLEKIKYYLSHEKEREMIAERAYKKTINKYNREKQLISAFTSIFNSRKKISSLPLSKKRVIVLTKKDLFSNLNERLKGMDYVSFKNKNLSCSSKLKNYFLSRAISVTDKPISCCDYYVSSSKVKDYLVLISKSAFKRRGKEANEAIDINQLMVQKDFFLKNIKLFQNLANRKKFNLIDKENTAFVSIPLISIKKIKKMSYEKMKKTFEFRFQNELFSLTYQKKLFIKKYPYFLILKSLFGSNFILRYLFELLRDRNNLDKLSVNEVYIKNSPLENLNKKKRKL